jgi:acetoacetyl-CoA synthetase
VTFFGAGAAFFANCLKAGVDLSTCGDLSAVRALGTTGSPLSEEAQRWGTEQFRRLRDHQANSAHPEPNAVRPEPVEGFTHTGLRRAQPERGAALPERRETPQERAPDIWWCNISGGTDFAGAFIHHHQRCAV